MSGRGMRRLSAEDRLLWEEVGRTVTPLAKRKPAPERADEAGVAERQPPPAKTIRRVELPAYQAPAQRPALKSVRQLDDKTARKLGKARLDIDGRIDLHGLPERRAHAGLLRFLESARRDDWRIVLVITGKGAASGGILRNAVPRWLHEPAFSALVSGYRQAHRTHGGEGALYVRIRRDRGRKP